MNIEKIRKEYELLEVDLNDLPKYSPWPGRILGLTDWVTKQRDESQVLNEYGDKWGALIKTFEDHDFNDLGDLLRYFFDKHFPHSLLFHLDERIFYADNNPNLWKLFYSEIFEVLSESLDKETVLVELGSGWGRNLFYAFNSKLCERAIGGEYTPEGVRLGNMISNKYSLPIEFHPFDYYKPSPEFLNNVRGAVVFSHNSVEQIVKMPEETISMLIENSPRVVVHFEPVYEYRENDSLLHYLWKKYTIINDYNRNLITVLKDFEKRGWLKIIREDVHSFGLNAFNPGSTIVWEPVR